MVDENKGWAIAYCWQKFFMVSAWPGAEHLAWDILLRAWHVRLGGDSLGTCAIGPELSALS